jgi:squalene synthase HpnC
VAPHDAALVAAYDACARLARTHYENFPVASWIVPRRMRPHIAAIYAFARTADDFADEGDVAPAERLRHLDEWGERLRRCVAAPRRAPAVADGPGAQPVGAEIEHAALFLALSNTIEVCRLPVALFEDLLSAFRQDVRTHRYESWDQLLDYCRRSANPVGRLVLRVAGHDDPRLDRSADSLCTALQLTNFWQDFQRDHAAGRIYVPVEEWTACGAREADLDGRRLTPAWRDALERVGARTRELFQPGRLVCDGVSGRLGLELRMTWHGGLRILERLERSRFDVLSNRPVLGPRDSMHILWKALTWRRG